ncbi:hypothetical protein FB45DRAFT_859646 [Roridomyces roridus]|uniref:F-box domain-containing protein n=1 Tax=Roridomyces roridus TaxID=1738132 RepID=A0AAD7CKE5_9AGAR|nr:hypothetical protein FB45DRAFT_859646 [Roridomyces roridus]
MSSAVDHIPELYGQILHFLENSDLNFTSLVSWSFAAPSRALLFREIVLHSRSTTRRLARVLDCSPHLIQSIRILRVHIRSDVLIALPGVRFVALQEIHFTELEDTCPISLAQQLICGLPDLRKLTLSSGVRDLMDFHDLFHNLPTTVTALGFNRMFLTGPASLYPGISQGTKRLVAKSLQFSHTMYPAKWLLECPFDISHLSAFHTWSHALASITQFSQSSITFFRAFSPNTNTSLLSEFPYTTCLTLPAASSSRRRTSLRITPSLFIMDGRLLNTSDLFLRIDAALSAAHLPFLRHVAIVFEQETDFKWNREKERKCFPKLSVSRFRLKNWPAYIPTA